MDHNQHVHILVDTLTTVAAYAVFCYKIPNSKFFSRHLHGDLNLDEIKKRIATAVCKWRDESNEPN